MKKIIISILILLGYGFMFGGEVTKTGTTAANFLKLGVGARSVAMGGAYVAVTEDISALYWNPAGLTGITSGQFLFDHMDYFADINFNYFGVAYNVPGMGVFGASVTSFDYGDMERTTEFDPEGTGELFSAAEYAGQISFARQITDKFSIGFNAKYIYQGIWHSSAKGFALDIGTLYKTGFNGMKIGMAITNFGTKMQMSGKDLLVQTDIAPDISGNNETINAYLATDKFDLPLTFRVGIAMDVLQQEKQSLILALDALHPNDNAESVNLGFEYNYDNMVFIRGGYENYLLKDSPRGFSVGFGFSPKLFGNAPIQFDYAYQKWDYFDNIQKFSLVATF
ncbi:MAG: hypothetical protein Kow00108_11600 [Calditrichia bacterium]